MTSFVVPAYNEEAFLPATLHALHEAGRALGRPYEIVVADDGSTDDTGAVAAGAGARVVSVSHRQIAATRNAGARAARGDYLIFVDADTIVPPQTARAAVAALDAGVAGGGARVDFDAELALFWRLGAWTLGRAFRLIRLAAGSFLFCTREAFEAAGGFDSTMYVAEEIELSRALKRQGRFVVLRESVLTSARKLRENAPWRILGVVASLAIRGPKAVRRREGLELWYDQRTGGETDDPPPRSPRSAGA